MNSRRFLDATKRLGLWLALVLTVTLLTLLFSLLGTLTCAVVVGMMMGATRRKTWQAILASVVSPAVLVALALVGKTELGERQLSTLAFLCVGAFWGTYVLTWGLMRMEGRSDARAQKAVGAVGTRVIPIGGIPAKEPAVVDAIQAAGGCSPGGLDLASLCGDWWSEVPAADGHTQKRRLEISADRFAVSQMEADGLSQTLARGTIRWERAASPETLVLGAAADRDDSGWP